MSSVRYSLIPMHDDNTSHNPGQDVQPSLHRQSSCSNECTGDSLRSAGAPCNRSAHNADGFYPISISTNSGNSSQSSSGSASPLPRHCPAHQHKTRRLQANKMLGVRGCSLRHVFLAVVSGSILILLVIWAPWSRTIKADVLSVWSPERERNLSLYIRPHQATSLLQPMEPCRGDEMIVVVVPSRPCNVKNRDAIRATWGQWVRGAPYVKPIKSRTLLSVPQLDGAEKHEQRGHQSYDALLRQQQRGYHGYDALLRQQQRGYHGYDVVFRHNNTQETLGSRQHYDSKISQEKLNNLRQKRQASKDGDSGAENLKVNSVITSEVSRPVIKLPFNKMNLNLKFKLVFLLGLEENTEEPSASILAEQDRNGDIVLEDFVDSYQNLTIKSVFLLKYIKDACPRAKFIAKVDDDIFLHVPNLQNTLLDNSLPSKLMMGCLFCNARPILNPWNKWYSPKYMFLGDKYPNYLSGTSYVISGNLVDPLLQTALRTPLFHLEDVFLTGICAKKLGIRLTDNIGFSYQARPLNPCLYQNVTVGHEVSPPHMYRLWNLLHVEALVRACKPLPKRQVRHYKPTNCVWR